jgi:hypothetical protein
MGELGRRIPTDWRHVERYSLKTLIEDPAHPVGLEIEPERSLGLPSWWKDWDQGQEGSCVGYGTSAMMSVTNRYQHFAQTGVRVRFKYEPHWLYNEAQLIDEWPETPPEEGTSVRAACEILRTKGHRRVSYGHINDPLLEHGVETYRWAQNVDEMRAAISTGLAISIGVNWYTSFDQPQLVGKEWWLPALELGSVRGGHCVCIFRMSDKRQAFRFMNSWGPSYPPSWIPYETMERLLMEYGEAAVITDR